MLTPKMKQVSLIGAFALLVVLAVAGWTRTPTAPAAIPTANFATAAQPVAYDVNGRPLYGQQQPAYGTAAATDQNCLEPLPTAQTVAYNDTAPGYRTSSRPRVVREVREVQTRERASEPVVRKRNRSTAKSAAIVAGSAGAGAAIGAVAGGGKGAAIGALTGGVGGFVYDRLTHNR